ncbi:ComEA family DNA-binding protein [Rhodococcus coprophilus]|uniref:ComEA family DNA-binding protein n=1 Tax=Rhodococcus coprophilus TaxID=38310 RepID=UPI0033C61908
MASSDDGDVARSRLGAIARTAGREVDDLRDDQGYDEPEPPPTTTLSDRLLAARWSTGHRGTAALAGVGVLAVLVTVGVLWRDRPVPDPVPPLPTVEITPATTVAASTVAATTGATPEPETEPAALVVSVVGLVHRPGLVEIAPGARVADALDAAGGVAPGADLVGLNLARRISDGDQIVVGLSPPQPVPHGSVVSGAGPPDGGSGGPGAAGAPGQGKVDLNAADEATLDALPGVGPVTASSIVVFRQANGPFTDVEQLGEVDGIGPARLARLRELVTV